MNYIKSLQAENLELKANLASINSDLKELFMYLHSDKFSFDSSVNKQDILNRLQDARMTCSGFEQE